MRQVQMLLVGTRSGCREIIKRAVGDEIDMGSVEMMPGTSFKANEVESVIVSHNINVVVLDLDEVGTGLKARLSGKCSHQSKLARALLVKFPALVVVEFRSMGKTLGIQSEIHLNNSGINQFVKTIQAACLHA